MLENIKIPGDKSLSHRALIMAALRTGITDIENLSTGEDVQSTLKCLRALGVEIENLGKIRVRGCGFKGFKKPEHPLDCGNSGTTMRLMMGLLAAQNFETVLVGDSSLSKRPMNRVAEPLRKMGANIELSGGDHAPIQIYPAELTSLKYDLPVASSQVKSALILAGVVSGQEISLGGKTDSRDHTERMLPFFLENSADLSWRVPGDISAACFWITAGLLKKVKVKLEGVLLNETRLGFVRLLQESGANIQLELVGERPEPYGNIVVEPSTLKSFNVNKTPFLIDEIPLLVLLGTQAEGTSTITGAEELKYKESDRIEKTAEVLAQLGAKIQTTSDGFIITGPQQLVGNKVETFHDHRLTMMAAVAGLVCTGKVEFSETASAKISDPFFFQAWGNL